nr:unnamed protein product [Callosobruchus chinensis]
MSKRFSNHDLEKEDRVIKRQRRKEEFDSSEKDGNDPKRNTIYCCSSEGSLDSVQASHLEEQEILAIEVIVNQANYVGSLTNFITNLIKLSRSPTILSWVYISKNEFHACDLATEQLIVKGAISKSSHLPE